MKTIKPITYLICWLICATLVLICACIGITFGGQGYLMRLFWSITYFLAIWLCSFMYYLYMKSKEST